MTTRPAPSAAPSGSADVEHLNRVHLVGRLSAEPVERVLPSGDILLGFRLVVARGEGGVDTLDCVAFRADVRTRLSRWLPGDTVQVEGALRRRFWRGDAGPASRTEVEVRQARRLARA